MAKERVPVTEAEWKEWLVHPVTQSYRLWLEELVEEAKEAWARGSFTASDGTGTLQLNAEALGRVDAVQQLIDLDYEEFSQGGTR